MLWRFPKNAGENMGSIQGGLAMNDGGLLLVPSTSWQLYAVQTDARGLGEVSWPRYAYNSQNTSGMSYIPSSLSITMKNAPHIVRMEGGKVTLEVEATGGVKPYTYQWMRGGFPVAGANESTCTIENLEVEDEGEYYVIVRDSFRPHPKVLTSNTTKIEVNSTRTGEKRWTIYDSFGLSLAIDGYGYLYAISKSGTLRRLLIESGEAAYVLPTKNSYGTPVIYQSHEESPILLTFNETTDRITAFDANRFDKLWEEALYSFEFGNFGVVGDTVMAIRREMIYSLNCADGKRGKGLFSNIIALPLEFSMTGPGNALYFGTENKEIVALYIDPVGALRWRYSTVGRVVSPIAIDSDSTIYFTDDLGHFYAIDAGGKKKWTYDLTEGKKVDLKGATASPVVSSGGFVYVAANNGKIFAFDRSGKRKWIFQANGSVYSTPVLGNDDRIYICTSSGTVHALNSITGVEEWKYSLGNYRILGSPVLYEGKLLVGSEPLDEKGTGKLVAINVSSTGLDSGPWPKYRQNNMNTAAID